MDAALAWRPYDGAANTNEEIRPAEVTALVEACAHLAGTGTDGYRTIMLHRADALIAWYETRGGVWRESADGHARWLDVAVLGVSVGLFPSTERVA